MKRVEERLEYCERIVFYCDDCGIQVAVKECDRDPDSGVICDDCMNLPESYDLIYKRFDIMIRHIRDTSSAVIPNSEHLSIEQRVFLHRYLKKLEKEFGKVKKIIFAGKSHNTDV